MGVTYDTGALIAADRAERRMWARHRAFLERRQVPTVPAPVLAQAWRGGPRQAMLARLLAGCEVEQLDGAGARRVGVAVGATGSADIVDVGVAEGAIRRGDVVVTSDPSDIGAIARSLGHSLIIERP